MVADDKHLDKQEIIMPSSYSVSGDQRCQLTGLFLLDQLAKKTEDFYVDLQDDQKILEPVFKWLLSKQYVHISTEHKFEATIMGYSVLKSFRERFESFLKESDIFCAVDLGAGDFAFNYFDSFDNQDDWENFLNEDRWDDLRIAVAEHKGNDIIEIIFMDFVNEQYFGKDEQGCWTYEKTLGSIWTEIESIANSALKTEHLSYEDDGSLVSGTDVIKDIVSQGSVLIEQIQHH